MRFRRQAPRIVIWTLALLALGLIGWFEYHDPARKKARVFAAYEGRADPRFNDALFPRMRPPEAMEWLSVARENGQTYEEYGACGPIRPDETRAVFVLRPLGEFSPQERRLLGKLAEFLEINYGVPVRLEPPVPIPDSPAWYRGGLRGQRRQYHADRLVNELLMTRIPSDAVLVMGATREDIYTDPMAFIFGLASTHDRVGIFSLARLGGETVVLRRACKVMAHESGHMFSMLHCIYYDCLMNGSNTLDEMDRHPLHLCPLDLEKMAWGPRLDIPAHYRRLEEFYRRNGMNEEAEWVAKRRGVVGGPPT